MAERQAAVPPPDEAFVRLKALVIGRTGHFYYQDKDDLLWERVRKRLCASGLANVAAYLALLNDSLAGPEEWIRLEAEVTIGETFFFRYAEQFAALRGTILPEILERRRAERRLRIWSAGCATGAEPYSLAILVHQLLGSELETWRTSIVGTDINESFLATARRARFGKWALRSVPPDDRSRYFLPAEREQWQLRPEFRSLVRFERHNLLSLLDGTSPLQFTEFDLILCRNVLIYFHPDTVSRVVEALRDCLSTDGWMLLGHAEPHPFFSSLMQALSLPGTVAYRNHPGEGLPPARPMESTAPDPQRIAIPASAEKPRPMRIEPEVSLAPSDSADDVLDAVRAKADAGMFDEASALCRQGIETDPLNAGLHFYQGLIALAMKRSDQAERSFRNGIYLDKSFAMAHYHLGLLLLAEGRRGPGRRSMTNAARIAAGLPDDHRLDEADGLTAGDLRSLVRSHLDSRTGGED